MLGFKARAVLHLLPGRRRQRHAGGGPAAVPRVPHDAVHEQDGLLLQVREGVALLAAAGGDEAAKQLQGGREAAAVVRRPAR